MQIEGSLGDCEPQIVRLEKNGILDGDGDIPLSFILAKVPRAVPGRGGMGWGRVAGDQLERLVWSWVE